MPNRNDDFASLMKRAREGCPEAPRELFDQYGPAILLVVRRYLANGMRSRFDSSDFTQAVWASFFALHPQERLFDSPETLMAFLKRVARNKVIDEFRRCMTMKRGLRRERSLDGSAAYVAGDLVTEEPAPSQVAMTRELWDRLLRSLPPRHRAIMELFRQGCTNHEIADLLGIHEKVIQRCIANVLSGDWLRYEPGRSPAVPRPADDGATR